MTKELDEFLLVHKQFNPSYKPPRLDVDLQVQLNLSRKIMATQVGPKEYIIEVKSAGYFYQCPKIAKIINRKS